jgi:hypothetical protein
VCVLSVRTRSDSDAAYRSLARSASLAEAGQSSSATKVTDGKAKVKERRGATTSVATPIGVVVGAV